MKLKVFNQWKKNMRFHVDGKPQIGIDYFKCQCNQ